MSRPAAGGIVAALVLAACSVGPSAATPSESPSSPTSPSSAGDAARPIAAARPSTPTAVSGPERIHRPSLPRPSQPSMAVAYRLALVDDPCTDRDLPAPAAGDVALTVLDRSHALPASYAPDDLVAAAEAGLGGASGTKLVREALIDDLAAMRAAWEAAGLSISIDSAYRSYAAQAATFQDWVARLGLEAATVRTARPGHSEHQLGTAIDVSSPGWSGRFGDWARETDEGAWMAEHAWEYGFVMSYPAGAESESCFGYEPWHYRWIGRQVAADHRESGLVLRAFLERFAGG
ncbi:MAG: M15 family metallopeptidase [Chloroflexi bacterium]|nr:M15 family metallopeptidase [Chloroflexota bacterium]